MAHETKPQKGKTAAEALVTGGAAVLALILVNVLSCRAHAKLDLTEGGVYSLSAASKGIVRGMPEKVVIKAYFGNVPAEQSEKQNYVDMLLAEYADASNGKIEYEKIDPWSNEELKQELKKDGITPLRLQSLRDDTYEQVPMYFHVVFTHLDKKEVWTPGGGFALEGLEYEFTSRIKRLGYGKKKVGITTGFGEAQQAQVLMAPGADVVPGVKVGLGDLYDVQPVNWQQKPNGIDDLDLLIVNGPTTKLSDAAKYHLDQYIMKGKPVLFLVSGMKWQSGGNNQQQIPGMEDPDQPYLGLPSEPGVADLLKSYGVEVAQNVILDLRQGARGWIPPGSRQGMMARGVFPLAQSLQSGEKQMLEKIEVVALPFASSLTLTGALAAKSPDTEVIELLKTFPTSFQRKEVMAITRDMKLQVPENEHGPYLVGVAINGKLKSFYADHPVPPGADLVAPPGPGGAPMPDDGEADGPDSQPAAAAAPSGPLKESPSHTRMVVIGSPLIAADTTLMDIRNHGDMTYVYGFVALHNIVDWLAEDTELIAVRSKKVERPISKLEKGERAVWKYGNIVGAPLLLIVFGFAYWQVRESRRQKIVL